MQHYAGNQFDSEEMGTPTEVQWQEFNPSHGNTRKCDLCCQVKKVSDFPMSFTTRKSPNCRVCVLLKKRGLKCMPTDATTVSSNDLNEDTVSEGSGSATFEAASAPFSIGETSSANNQSTPRTMAKSFRKRLSWTSSSATSTSSSGNKLPLPPMMAEYA